MSTRTSPAAGSPGAWSGNDRSPPGGPGGVCPPGNLFAPLRLVPVNARPFAASPRESRVRWRRTKSSRDQRRTGHSHLRPRPVVSDTPPNGCRHDHRVAGAGEAPSLYSRRGMPPRIGGRSPELARRHGGIGTGDDDKDVTRRAALPIAPRGPSRRHPKRMGFYFSEPAREHPQYGFGCATYPIELVITPNDPTPVVHILKVPTPPEHMPAGEIQADPTAIVRLTQAGYRCSAIPVATMREYWAAARGRPVKGHFHPQARWVQY